jgi:ABC-type nitrate/sulfonate/bicarbonate transport system substrate-binding protein
MAGDLHFAGPAQTVSRSGVQGLPVATVAIMMDRPNYALLADKSIRTVDELRDKTIVTGAPTSGPGAVLVFLLEDLGFNPTRDVKILFIGEAGSRRAMLYQRQAQAGLINLDVAFKMQRKDPNLHPLVLPSKMPRVPFAGLGVSKKFLNEKPEIVERMIRANLEANQFIATKPEASQAFFAKLFELTAAESRQLWELLAPAVVADGLIGDDLLKIQVTQDAKILKRPDLTLAQVRAAYDFRITEKVAREMGLLRR